MVDSIARSTTLPTPTLDIALRGVVRTTHSEATADHLDHEAHERLEMVHGGVTALEAAGAGVELAEVAGVVGGASLALDGAALAAIVGSYALWIGSIYEAEQNGIAYDSEMMRGALAVFEGRLDDPETRIEMENNPAFRDGAARAERLFYSDHERFMSIATGVRNVGAQGADAVYAGRDSGPEFERRYEQELPFRHGVDTARGLREDDPARFEAERRQATQLRDGIDRARAGVPIPG
jgi:hypothetical protein